MAAVELATGYVTLTVETKSLARQVGQAFSGVESQAGRTGQAMGRAMTQSFNNSAPDIDGLRREVWTAHQKITASAEQSARKQQDASRKVEIAQAKVNETISKYGAASSQALSAADRLSTAQQRLEAETLAAASAQERLERELRDAQAAVTNAADASESAARTYATGWRGVGQRISGYLSRGVQDASDEAEGEAEQGGERSGSAFGNAFKAGLGLIAAKVSVDSLVGGIKGAITGAGDIEQSLGALESVFKDSAGQMMNWSRSAATAVGVSSNEYNELATLLGAQLKNAGVSLDDAGAKANGLIGTGADLSSMFGGTAAEAVEALSSALKGEMDPIEKYGITLNEAALKAQALASGLLEPTKDAAKVETTMMKMDLAQRKYNETVGKYGSESNQALSAKIALTSAQNAFATASEGSLPAMDSQTKAMATLAAIEKQSADAKGNFAKEEDTFSHKQQVAAAQWEDLSAKIGGIFLPVATAAFAFIGDKALPVLDEIVGGLKAFGAAFSSADDDITSAGFTGEMERFGLIARDTVGWFRENSEVIRNVAGTIGVLLIPALVRAGVAATISAGKQVIGWAASAAGAVGAGISYVATSYLVVASWVRMGWAAIQSGARIAAGWIMAMGPIGWIIGGVALLVGAFVLAYNKLGWFKDGVDTVLRAVGGFFVSVWENGIKPAFGWIVDALKNTSQWFKDVWEHGIKPALGWIVDALKNTGQWFKDVWDGAAKAVQVSVDWIMDAAGNVASFFDRYVAKPIKLVIDAVGAAFMWWQRSIVEPVFDKVFTVVNGFYLLFRGIFQLVVAIFKEIIAPGFMFFWRGVVEPVFKAVGDIVSKWWTGAKLVFELVVNFIRGTLGVVFTWLRDSIINPVFTWIGDKVSKWWNATKLVFDVVVAFIRGTLSSAFTWLRDSIIGPVFGWIGDKVTKWWNATKFLFDLVVFYVRQTLGVVFTWLRDSIINPVFTWIGDKISKWWTGAKLVFEMAANFIRGTLSSAFTWFRDSVVAPVFNSVRDKISSVWTDGIKPVFDFMSNAIKNDVPKAFETGVAAVTKAWDKVKAVAGVPVKFVIEKVINGGLIGAFNKVAGMLPGVDALPLVDTKSLGFARGGILPGYQAAKRDDVLTPMRSGEGVLVPEVVRGIGPSAVHAMNAAGNRGGVSAVRRMVGYAMGGIVSPLRNMALTQGYDRVHKGIDLAASVGTPVYATESGRVALSGPGASAPGISGGNEIHIDGSSGIQTWFAHLSSMAVKVGDMVRAGQQIGLSGNTGITSGPHLHFGAFNPGWPNDIDPQTYLGGEIKGSGGGGFNPVAALAGMAKDKLSAAFPGGGKMVELAIGTGEKLIGSVSEWVTGKLGSLVDSAVTGVKSVANNVGMRAKWMPSINAALIRSGHGDFGLAANSESMFRRMMQESGGDPNAINNWDSNAAAGLSSRGLMQVIPSTFAAYRDAGLSADIFNPMANLVASINYTQDRYGNLRKGWDQSGGYALGGIVTPTLFDGGGWLTNTGGPQLIDHQRSKPDAVLTNQQWRDVHELVSGNESRGGDTWHVQLPEKASVSDLMDAVSHKERVNARGGGR